LITSNVGGQAPATRPVRRAMNLEKVIFGFFVLLAATLNFGFFIGDISDPQVHNIYELFAALAVSLIATVLKFGDRTQIGAVHLATSLVADLQLVAAGVVWIWAREISAQGMTAVHTASMVSLSGGALLANLVSVVLLVTETVTFHRG
jgi:hypothetical protein